MYSRLSNRQSKSRKTKDENKDVRNDFNSHEENRLLRQGSRDGLRPPSSGVRLRPLSKKFDCPPSASVRLGKMFERPRSESVLEADGEGASVVRTRPVSWNLIRPPSESVL